MKCRFALIVGGTLATLASTAQAEEVLNLRFSGTFLDSSPHQHSIVPSGDVGFVPGPVGFDQGVRFVNPTPGPDVTPQLIDCGRSPLFALGAELTVGMWLKPDPAGSDDTEVLITNGSADGSSHGWRILRNPARSSIEFSLVGQTGSAGGTLDSDSADGVWRHVALVRRNNEVRVFRQGKLLGALGLNPITPRNYEYLWVGGVSGQDLGFNGSLDEIHVYNHALSDDEVAALAMALEYRWTPPGQLTLLWSWRLPAASLQVRRQSAAGPGEWSPVPGSPVYKEGVWEFEVEPVGEPAFYRLIKK